MKKEFNNFVQVLKICMLLKGMRRKHLYQRGICYCTSRCICDCGNIQHYSRKGCRTSSNYNETSGFIDPKNKIDLDAKLEKDVAFEINGKEVKVSKDMTYKDLVNKINNGNYGVSVYSLGGQLFFTSTTAGEKGEINLVDGKEGF